MTRAAIKHILTPILCIALLTACTSPQPPTPTATNALPPTPSPTQTLTPTFTITPSPAPSLSPTATRLPPTDTPAPTLEESETPIPYNPNVKQVLIDYGSYGGDGGPENGIYYGRDMPRFILYTDGQLILKTPDDLMEKTLSANEICSLLSKIKATGFFEVPEGDRYDFAETHKPIYHSVTATPDIGEGGNYYVLSVSGEQHKLVAVYYKLKDYLIEPVQQAFDLVTSYKPNGLKPYRPQQVVLWVEPIYPSADSSAAPTPAPQTWPANLPTLGVPLNEPASRQINVSGKDALQVQKLFNQLPGDGVFIDQGQPYLVIARPLLPNETPDNFPFSSNGPVSVELPFKCTGQ